MQKSQKYDLIVVGAGAAGLVAAITAGRMGARTLLIEKLSSVGSKLKATGGGRCNLTNTLSNEEFMERFGKSGRFMGHALEAFDSAALIRFFEEIGVKTHAPDGYRVFPVTHDSSTVVSALQKEALRVKAQTVLGERVIGVFAKDGRICGVNAQGVSYLASKVILATGAMGYPKLGAEGDGYGFAASFGHTIVEPHPAMLPLYTKERWVANCKADTIAKAKIKIDLPKAKNLSAKGDLIFTERGIRGPVVLDFAREVTPFIASLGEAPLLVNMTKGMNEEQIRGFIKQKTAANGHLSVLEHLNELLPLSVAKELCILAGVDFNATFARIDGAKRDALVKILTWTPLTAIGSDGFGAAMITRGGVSLKEIDPRTMESRVVEGLYFCGEIVDIDGPCGGYNLQWAFSSGFLAASSAIRP